ncbi:MAG: threonine--tRNA ligase [Firmicutes bacterium]|nr:threonine--tRNA ligase [Bacillota bacterium]
MVNIKLKDGNILQVESGSSIASVAEKISENLARMALVAKISFNEDGKDAKLVDLSTKLEKDCSLSILTYKDDAAKEVYRHTASHILANAVKNIYPNTRLGMGPATDDGFYYDFDFVSPIKLEDLAKIEAEMQNLINQDLPISRIEKSRAEALKTLDSQNQLYKLDILKDIKKGEKISIYKQDGFVDLCNGPHLSSTGKIKAFKLTKITGAYWKGDQKNTMLTRIYGVAFDKKSELSDYLELQEQIKQRDHNRIGRELDLFITNEYVGQGLPLLPHKGAKMFQILQRMVEDEVERRGYQLTKTPHKAKREMYKLSGHWDYYKDNMFIIGDELINENDVYALRPMTCPFQFFIYKSALRSYKDLPIKYFENALLARKEKSGEMHGLIRVNEFTLSDAHIICRADQVHQVFADSFELIMYFIKIFGFEDIMSLRLSKWDAEKPEDYIGDAKMWEESQSIIRKILKSSGHKFVEADGEAAFYGPKVDIQMKNVYGKEDTVITIQLDMALAERYDMSYIDDNGNKVRPIIIHQSIIGCYERTLAMLIEKHMGAFPVWLSPTQVKILTISEKFNDYAREVAAKLHRLNFRIQLDARSEKIGYKIRQAQLEKMPYMVVIGEKEMQDGTIAVRRRDGKDLGAMKLEKFTELINKDLLDFK